MDRSDNMRAVRGKDTRPEKIVRSMLHKDGYRFRLHPSDLPGTPDIVFPSRKKAVFVHGCFWHSHDCRRGVGAPATNAAFWQRKRELTVQRDRKALSALSLQGWQVHIVWECELKDLEAVRNCLRRFLSSNVRARSGSGRSPGLAV